MGCFWFAVGAFAMVAACLFLKRFEKKGAKPGIVDWVVACLAYAYCSFAGYFVVVSLLENQPKAAGVGFGLFGAVGLVLVVVLRLFFRKRFGKAKA